uniref:Uncharacterized protein n=1 Tax=Megaviridae environmental sample TaxID=1737588 RepID=A0A5J6VKE2_9VIRU|nr:MAG: hypothetical protein [Megaviridae environmental sample]
MYPKDGKNKNTFCLYKSFKKNYPIQKYLISKKKIKKRALRTYIKRYHGGNRKSYYKSINNISNLNQYDKIMNEINKEEENKYNSDIYVNSKPWEARSEIMQSMWKLSYKKKTEIFHHKIIRPYRIKNSGVKCEYIAAKYVKCKFCSHKLNIIPPEFPIDVPFLDTICINCNTPYEVKRMIDSSIAIKYSSIEDISRNVFEPPCIIAIVLQKNYIFSCYIYSSSYIKEACIKFMRKGIRSFDKRESLILPHIKPVSFI